MSGYRKNIEDLNNIISKTRSRPTIVNPDSNFVVVTYWWGKGNYNANTARPCIAFYEQLIQNGLKYVLKSASSLYISSFKNVSQLQTLIKNITDKLMSLEAYRNYLNKNAKSYIGELYEECKIKIREPDAEQKLIDIINMQKEIGKTPNTYKLKTPVELVELFNKIIQEAIMQNIDIIAKLVEIEHNVLELKDEFNKLIKNANRNRNQGKLDNIKAELDKYVIIKANIKKNIIQSLKTKAQLSRFREYNKNVSIIDVLNMELRYLNPLKFEEMISKWDRICEENKCNYLSVEYPEFAQPGGYQLAINAKPIFIKKALELCGDRAIVYIDGDMFVRKYPKIFDIKNIDFMARGWWIDPRGSSKMDESIVYDPYMFETSGGIMYFSQSKNSKFLIDKWINVSSTPSQAGKADDRILSLIFNSYKLLLSMKIIQLPIEYLWLTMRYNEYMMEYIYDYNENALLKSIVIEHPECLTSEETAAGAGASSDRTPKYYEFIGEDYVVPVSEEFHEYLMFPNKEMVSAFDKYLEYMNETTYMDDGSEYLIKKKLVDVNNPENNESPLYIIPYDKKLGDKKSSEDEQYSFNEISVMNFKRASNDKIKNIPIVIEHNNVVEIRDDGKYIIKQNELISLIMRLMMENKTIIYNPMKESDYDISYYNKLIGNIDILYKDIECGFVPIINSNLFSDFFKPEIDLSQVMLFRGGNTILINFLSMFLSLEALSSTLKYGSYEFMSRVNVGYIKKDKITQKPDMSMAKTKLVENKINKKIGGSSNIRVNNFMNEYEYMLDEISSFKYDITDVYNKNSKSPLRGGYSSIQNENRSASKKYSKSSNKNKTKSKHKIKSRRSTVRKMYN